MKLLQILHLNSVFQLSLNSQSVRKDGTYLVNLQEVKTDDLHYCKEDLIELTKRHVKLLEEMIRANPGLWAWQHRKWKHQPKINL